MVEKQASLTLLRALMTVTKATRWLGTFSLRELRVDMAQDVVAVIAH